MAPAAPVPSHVDYRCRACARTFPVFHDDAGEAIWPLCHEPKHVCCSHCGGEAVEPVGFILGQEDAGGLTDEDYFEAYLKP